MTLLMYEDVSKCPLKELAEFGNRQKLASEVNKAVLKAQGHSADVKIGFYWQLLGWSQA